MMKLAAVAGLTLVPSLISAHAVNRTAGAAYCEYNSTDEFHTGTHVRSIVLTNEVSGNFIVSNAIGLDGKLTLGEAFSVGGVGMQLQSSFSLA